MKFSFHTILASLLALPIALAALPATAGPTKLANMPLMSLTGSGTVKPNLMLVYDDSGSMAYMSTPDYVDDGDSCRGRAIITEENGVRACAAGHVPYHTSQFNRQYYNPQTRYLPPVDYLKASYPTQNAKNSGDWKQVPTDGFKIDNKDFTGAGANSTNLLTGFPDLKWCRFGSTTDCKSNIAGYTYPDNTYTEPYAISGNPYYYTLHVNEYCKDTTLTDCVSTGVNAPAPNTTYAEPALLRWCSDKELTKCRAKNATVNNVAYKYPRFGDPYRSPNWYTTITINDSGSSNTVVIDQVIAAGKAGSNDIMNGGITFAGGTDTPAERNNLAAQLAKSILAKTGLARQFVTCLRTANSPVRKCEDYGINLAADNMVAVIAVTCTGANKTGCTVVKEGERTGDVLTVVSPGSTGLLRFSGTTANGTGNNRTRISNLRFAGQTFFATGTYLGQRINATAVVASIVASIGTEGVVKAYVGGSPVTPTCDVQDNTTLCLVGPYLADNSTPSIAIANAGSLTVKATTSVNSFVPTSVSGFDTGVFTRTDIVSTRDSYPKALTRTDCQGTTCTYVEEMTNFANWYTYYKTRNQMMKTAVGHAVQPLDGDFKVGLVGLQRAANDNNYADATDVLTYPDVFDGDHRKGWYKTLYEMNAKGGTPVRVALHEMGLMYSNKGVFKQAKDQEVVKFACQQNFTFVTTDGYWNGPTVSGVDNVDIKADATRFCTQDKGCPDDRAQTEPSLADVALYWYNGGTNENPADEKKKSLRPDIEVADPLVASSGNKRLHMRTYALGLGVDGLMTYDPKYASDRKKGGDLDNIINQVKNGCPWTSNGVYSWPDPDVTKVGLGDSIQARVDDLWHAAINGGGKYFAASDTQQVVDGLNEVLNDIREATGAAASSATSTPNISLEDADIFSSTFTTVKWTGNLSKRVIDPLTGIVDPQVKWSSSWTLGDKVQAATDSRSIWYRAANGKRAEVTVDGLSATELAWFTNKCGAMTQCGNLSAANQKIVNAPETLIGWLRGQQQYANGVILRAYHMSGTAETKTGSSAKPVVLGDIASSKPAYLRGARKSYTSSDYAQYRRDQAERKPTVFIAANDGMLHAFDAESGEEMWAYMPRITMKKLHLQASVGYATDHQFTVDGSPELADVEIGGKWRTVLVAGLNAGGRGYYALDVTDPASPEPLWEICADSTVCTGDSYQPEIGYSFGNPQFGTIKANANGEGKDRWVAFLTSGYNNIPGSDALQVGSGKGFLFVVDIANGAQVLNLGETNAMYGSTGLLTTGSGGIGNNQTNVENPSGFAKITAISDNPHTDPLITHIYGGDEFGQMWHFDFTGDKVKRVRMGSAGITQPITTRPDVAMCLVNVEGVADQDGKKPILSEKRRTVAFGTGRLLAFEDIALNKMQTLYVLKDDGKPVEDNAWRGNTFAKRSFVENVPVDPKVPEVVQKNVFSIGGAAVDMGKQNGWYVDFNPTSGERVNLDPKIVSGTLTVITNVPASSTACAVGGVSFAYHLDLCSGKAVANVIAGSMLSDSAAAVGFIIVRLPSGALKMITTTATGETITSEVSEANAKDARRTGWRRVRD